MSNDQHSTLVPNLIDLIEVIQPEKIVRQTVYKGDDLQAIVFAFDAEQQLSEHSTKKPAVIQILQGDALVTLGDEAHELHGGSWIHLPANLKHSIHAKTTLIMMLMLIG